MANTLRIKRRAAGGAAGAPTSLAAAELAFNEVDNTLYYGRGDNGSGQAVTIIPIAVAGAGGGVKFTAASTAPGSPTAGDFWFDLSVGVLSIYVDDSTSSQWIQVSGSSLVTLEANAGRLTYVSATALSFAPYNGSTIKIAGAFYTIPAAGIAGLANTNVYVNGVAGQSLAINTTYYVYAFLNGSVVTGDFSTTGHATSATAGNAGTEIKHGDDTRSLIGMVRTLSPATFTDSAGLRLVISWFNRRNIQLYIPYINGGTAAVGPVEASAAARCHFLTWGEESVHGAAVGYSYSSAIGPTLSIFLYLDGTTGLYPIVPSASAPAANYIVNLSGSVTFSTTEGYHYITWMMGTSSGLSATFNGSCNGMIRG
jgi:hypothetical protein